MKPQITSFVLGEFQTNCFVVTVPGSPRCWIVDCGYDPEPMLDHVERERLEPVALLLTHCHSDHIAGVDAALARFGPLPTYVHRSEAAWCGEGHAVSWAARVIALNRPPIRLISRMLSGSAQSP